VRFVAGVELGTGLWARVRVSYSDLESGCCLEGFLPLRCEQ